jgi:hypothetical protein
MFRLHIFLFIIVKVFDLSTVDIDYWNNFCHRESLSR